MNFEKKLSVFNPPKEIKFNERKLLPDKNEIFYTLKRKEIIEKYNKARHMMNMLEPNIGKIYPECTDDDPEKYLYNELCNKAIYYESALFFYNSIVDLIYIMCYCIFEYRNVNTEILDQYLCYDSLKDILMDLEKITITESDFKYLAKGNKKLEQISEQISEFHKSFFNVEKSTIRKKYNYIKHRGDIVYDEIESICKKYRGEIEINFCGQKILNDSNCITTQYSLNQSIGELRYFDNEILFPFIEKLFKSLEDYVQLSNKIL